jgi:hypothetical protein
LALRLILLAANIPINGPRMTSQLPLPKIARLTEAGSAPSLSWSRYPNAAIVTTVARNADAQAMNRRIGLELRRSISTGITIDVNPKIR